MLSVRAFRADVAPGAMMSTHRCNGLRGGEGGGGCVGPTRKVAAVQQNIRNQRLEPTFRALRRARRVNRSIFGSGTPRGNDATTTLFQGRSPKRPPKWRQGCGDRRGFPPRSRDAIALLTHGRSHLAMGPLFGKLKPNTYRSTPARSQRDAKKSLINRLRLRMLQSSIGCRSVSFSL